MTTGQQVSAERELVTVQRARLDAAVAGDVAALEGLLADDLTYFHSSARVDTKTSFIDSVREGRPFKAIVIEDQRVRVFGDVGVITAVMHITLRGAEQDRILNVRCTDVWARRQGRWQEVAWQTTRLSD